MHGNMWAVVSSNCWGAGIYQDLEAPYNSPFIGLFVMPGDFIRLLRDFNRHMEENLRFAENSRYRDANYPVGILGDGIEIHFMHYTSQEGARLSWERRTDRMPRDPSKLFFQISDRSGFTQEHLRAFAELDLPHKLCMVRKGRFADAARHGALEMDSPEDSCEPGPKLWEACKRLPDFCPFRWLYEGAGLGAPADLPTMKRALRESIA
ncbi:DUF1919 domain-containing protein [Azospirillum sp. SYSU D00513]|uniref:DUF1919 domain-containing protein n=1 Tax=Azospirillum sp. SYSU D00513 TaxID=2812561 RepID=UPI0020004B64|nr:DUF1919 domain-containing protein [Azospirillum sp. SYSU D00513]